MEQAKQAKTIEEQIELLKSRGVVINDLGKAKETLLDVGFYRLGFYSFPFEKNYPRLKGRDHEVTDGTSFDDIVALYYFDTDLRNILIRYINRIEISIRTYLTYKVSNKYNAKATWFVDTSCVNRKYANSFKTKVYKPICKYTLVIRRHHIKYRNDRFAPAWKTLEFMTFGNIVALFNNLKDEVLQDEIAWHFGCNIKMFQNYCETVRVLRNSCAHGTCIYDIKLQRGIASGPAGRFTEDVRHNISGILSVVSYILCKISENRKTEMCDEIKALVKVDRGGKVDDVINESVNYFIKNLHT